jgi:hypothetical protein
MPQQNSQNSMTPNLNNAYLDKSAPGITFGVWSIVTSIIPLVGFILGIVAIIKGFSGSHRNKVLGILGVVGVILSIGFFAIFFYISLTLDRPVYGELTTKSGVLSGQFSDSGFYDYSFKYPKDDFRQIDTGSQNALVLEDISEVDTESSISRIVLVVEEAASGPYDENVFKTEIGKQTMISLISQYLGSGSSDTEITSVNTEHSALFGDAVLFEFSSFLSASDTNIKGELVYVDSPGNGAGYTFFLATSEQIWNDNVDVFFEMRDSLNNR